MPALTSIVLVVIVVLAIRFYLSRQRARASFLMIPEQFVVFDLETTGLKPETHEIIEVGAIRVYRDRTEHVTYQALIAPKRKVPKKITEITGITQEMVDADGRPAAEVLREFIEFIGSDRLVAFNADFDMAFLKAGLQAYLPGATISNPVSCALKMARRAWPGLRSYKLVELAGIGNLSDKDTHRALGDCQRTMIVYGSAVRKVGNIS